MKNSIVLIGMSGVGKSTVGKQVSKLLEKEFVDLDSVICDKHHQKLQDIINEIGKDAFLKLEEESCLEVQFNNMVFSPGGSLVYSQKAMNYCQEHAIIIYLEDSLENLKKRVINWESRGIVGLSANTYEGVFKERETLYKDYADIIVPCMQRSWEEISHDILEQLNRYRA